jgi:hypothetical protein
MGEIVRDVRIIRWMLATLLAIVITGFGLLGTNDRGDPPAAAISPPTSPREEVIELELQSIGQRRPQDVPATERLSELKPAVPGTTTVSASGSTIQ